MNFQSIVRATCGLVLLAAPAVVLAQGTGSKNWTMPRTPDGKPDLQGIWTNATFTPMERTPSVSTKPTLTEDEAKAYVKATQEYWKKYEGRADNPIADQFGSGGTGGYNSVYVDRGSDLAKVDGVYRSSLVIDPEDGKVPPISQEGRRRNSEMMRAFNKYDSAKDRPLGERCIVGFGSTSGPPMLPVLYNNNYQIVQTPDRILILVEMVHDARIVRMNDQHAPASVKQWLGDSVGHWEGDTLVVDTIGFSDEGVIGIPGGGRRTAASHLVERYRLVKNGQMLSVTSTWEDPSTYSKSHTYEFRYYRAPKGTEAREFDCNASDEERAKFLTGTPGR